MSDDQSAPPTECCCGGEIVWQPMPPDVDPDGVRGFYKHVSTGQRHCYVDEYGSPTDELCLAFPMGDL